MSLDTVADYVAATRTLLQDTSNSPYRYSDADLLLGLNEAFQAAKRLRPDLFISLVMPQFSAVDTTAVVWDPQYRLPLVYFMISQAQFRDEEDTQDQRASAFYQMFRQIMTAGG